jgi:asparagine synthetase B (glutamine-hydrolysing)
MGIAGGIDHRAAGQMAALVHCPHHSHLLDEQFLADFEQHLKWMVHLTDGHYLSQCIVMPTLPVYRDLGIQVLLRGHSGELMHMTKAYNFSLDKEALAIHDTSALERWLLRHLRTYMSNGVEGKLFAPSLRDRMERFCIESLRECLEESEGLQPTLHRIWHLFLTQRSRRETAMSLVKFGSVTELRLPYLDNDLVDALLAAPPRLKLGDDIQTYILRRRRPQFLGVVNANTGARMGAGPLARLLAKVRLKVLARLRVQGYQHYERLGLWLRRELRPLVRSVLLSEACLGRGLFNPRTVQNVVDSHLDGRRNHTYLLLALMIFEIGQREFTGPTPASAASVLCSGAPEAASDRAPMCSS